MTNFSNERKQFDVKSESDNLVLTGSATYHPSGDIRDFNGQIKAKSTDDPSPWNGWFNYSESDGMVSNDTLNSVPVNYDAEACGLKRSVIADIRAEYGTAAN